MMIVNIVYISILLVCIYKIYLYLFKLYLILIIMYKFQQLYFILYNNQLQLTLGDMDSSLCYHNQEFVLQNQVNNQFRS